MKVYEPVSNWFEHFEHSAPRCGVIYVADGCRTRLYNSNRVFPSFNLTTLHVEGIPEEEKKRSFAVLLSAVEPQSLNF